MSNEALLKELTDTVVNFRKGFEARMFDVEQKLARDGGSYSSARQTKLADAIGASAGFKSFAAGETRGYGLRLSRDAMGQKAVTTSIAGTPGGPTLAQPTRLDSIAAPTQRRLTIRDLLPVQRIETGSLELVRENSFTNNAATVAEGGMKPETHFAFGLQTVPARTIAHWTHLSKQVLSDAPMLASYIESRLRYGLQLSEEFQFMQGDGVGQNVLGLIPQATAYAAPFLVPGATHVDMIRLAIAQLEDSYNVPTGIVINPLDWARIQLQKNGDGDYLNERGTWDIPRIVTKACPVGNFLVGDFTIGAMLLDRWEVTVQVATEDGDDFVRNMAKILVEERVGLAVLRPDAFVYGAFPT